MKYLSILKYHKFGTTLEHDCNDSEAECMHLHVLYLRPSSTHRMKYVSLQLFLTQFYNFICWKVFCVLDDEVPRNELKLFENIENINKPER